MTVIPIVYCALGTVTKGNKTTSGDHSYNSIVDIGQNTEKSPGNLRRLIVTQTSVESYQLRLGENIKGRKRKKQ